jgi:uncharacterized membrane protein
MTLAPLLDAEPLIQVHAFVAVAAVALGAVQLTAPKGTIPHRTFGWIWIALIVGMLVPTFVKGGISPWDPFGPGVCCKEGSCGSRATSCASIHLLSVYFVLALPFAVLHARRGDVFSHRRAMLWLYLGVLLIGTAFTFLPDRIMHDVAFGPSAGGIAAPEHKTSQDHARLGRM